MVAVALVVFAWVETLRPASLGLEPRIVWDAMAIRPNLATLRFFRDLEDRGNSGPILEVPTGFMGAPRGVLLSAYHHRRTHQCWNSYRPPGLLEMWALDERLPDREVIRGLGAQGFTTIVVHNRVASLRFAQFAASPEGSILRHIHGDGARTAWEIMEP